MYRWFPIRRSNSPSVPFRRHLNRWRRYRQSRYRKNRYRKNRFRENSRQDHRAVRHRQDRAETTALTIVSRVTVLRATDPRVSVLRGIEETVPALIRMQTGATDLRVIVLRVTDLRATDREALTTDLQDPALREDSQTVVSVIMQPEADVALTEAAVTDATVRTDVMAETVEMEEAVSSETETTNPPRILAEMLLPLRIWRRRAVRTRDV